MDYLFWTSIVAVLLYFFTGIAKEVILVSWLIVAVLYFFVVKLPKIRENKRQEKIWREKEKRRLEMRYLAKGYARALEQGDEDRSEELLKQFLCFLEQDYPEADRQEAIKAIDTHLFMQYMGR